MGHLRRATVSAVACGTLLVFAAVGSLSTAAAPLARDACPAAAVLASRGSGDTPGKDKGLGAPGLAFFTVLDQLDPGVQPWANPYNAVSIFSLDPRKLINGAGALTQTSGLHVGAYHDSVVDGEKRLTAKIAATVAACQAKTKIVLVGYSQGAQVTADVFERSLSDSERSEVAAVVLFGDPYFNGGNRAVDRGSFSGRRDGLLGRRPSFGSTGKTLVLSYCHSHDPICQGIFFRLGPIRTLDPGSLTFAQHKNYTDFGEPQAAAALVAKLLPRSTGATPTGTTTTTSSSSPDAWPTHRNDGPPALFIWLGASFIFPSWSSCTAVYCLVGDDSDQRVLVFKIQGGINELGWLVDNQDPRTALAHAGFTPADVDALLSPSG